MTAKKSSNSSGKETIYIDVDDEITHIIDKVKSSSKKIVALVLPKRATILQSIVNMKLLKKAATSAKKSIVLITSETSLLPLAGAAGIHVAKSLQSKPVIPPLPDQMSDNTEESIDLGDDSASIDKTSPIGVLAAAAGFKDDETETVEFDNLKVDDEPIKAADKKPKRVRGLKVPNFERFRLGFVLAGLGVLLLVIGWVLAAIVLPRAVIAIKTDTTSIVSSFDFNADTSQGELDVDGRKVPAVMMEVKKIDTERTQATGERDDGKPASGEVTLSVACGPGGPVSVPIGTAVSTGGLNFITQEKATLVSPVFNDGSCEFNDTVDVVSAENGDKYNIEDGKSFDVAGFSSVSGSNKKKFSGGISKIVKIVSQDDADEAASKIESRQSDSAVDELAAMLEAEGLLPLRETIAASEAKITVNPEVGKEADDLTVTSETTYTLLGIKRDHLLEIIKNDIADDVDLKKQSITDDGIDSAIMRINNNPSPDKAFISFRTSVTAGPEINQDEIKEFAKGKKRGEVEGYVESITGVQQVEVTYSPFWVYSTPRAAKKIVVEIENPDSVNAKSSSSKDE